MAKKKIFEVKTEEQWNKMMKRLKANSAYSPSDLIPKDELKVWLLRAYGEGFKRGYDASRNVARKGKSTEPTGASFHRKRLKLRDRFLAKLAPELIPDADELTQFYTAEEMELITEKELDAVLVGD